MLFQNLDRGKHVKNTLKTHNIIILKSIKKYIDYEKKFFFKYIYLWSINQILFIAMHTK